MAQVEELRRKVKKEQARKDKELMRSLCTGIILLICGLCLYVPFILLGLTNTPEYLLDPRHIYTACILLFNPTGFPFILLGILLITKVISGWRFAAFSTGILFLVIGLLLYLPFMFKATIYYPELFFNRTYIFIAIILPVIALLGIGLIILAILSAIFTLEREDIDLTPLRIKEERKRKREEKRKRKQKPKVKRDKGGEGSFWNTFEISEQFYEKPDITEVRRSEERGGKETIDLHKRAEALLRQKKYKEAIVYYDEVIQLDPSDELAWEQKGLILAYFKKFKEARECLIKGNALDKLDKILSRVYRVVPYQSEVSPDTELSDEDITFDPAIFKGSFLAMLHSKLDFSERGIDEAKKWEIAGEYYKIFDELILEKFNNRKLSSEKEVVRRVLRICYMLAKKYPEYSSEFHSISKEQIEIKIISLKR